MSILASRPVNLQALYPDSDGKRMAENTKQYRWIVTVQGGLEAMYDDVPNVFVAGDLLWYAVEGRPRKRQAPDVMVVFGRPKGDRGSYRQWQEGGIAPQVVFEILSPGNRFGEMLRKFRFYERHGVEEYYVYDPDNGTLEGWQRRGARLKPIRPMEDWTSPRLGVRFTLEGGELALYRPDGRRFLTFTEVQKAAEQAQAKAAAAERQVAAAERQVAAAERQAATAQEQTARLLAQLEALGVKPDLPDTQ
jgi:Uma2 family endonuclease